MSPPFFRPSSRVRTLEDQNTTISDVLSIFIAIAIAFGHVFQDPKSSIYQYRRQESYDAFNRRFDKSIEGSTQDIFWIGFLLDPSKPLTLNVPHLTNLLFYYHDGALRLNLPPRESFSRDSVSPFFLQLIISARLMLSHEQQHMQSGGVAEANRLV
ncbi:hypothetical protein C8J56DRAFT_1060849 [Mycena floridula]|nr:hypothetical protein C8J56DRAFT_1060849 [Mycena floridula]